MRDTHAHVHTCQSFFSSLALFLLLAVALARGMGDARKDGNGIRILHLGGRDALVDIRMKVEVVARRARLYYSERKEWMGEAGKGASREMGGRRTGIA